MQWRICTELEINLRIKILSLGHLSHDKYICKIEEVETYFEAAALYIILLFIFYSIMCAISSYTILLLRKSWSLKFSRWWPPIGIGNSRTTSQLLWVISWIRWLTKYQGYRFRTHGLRSSRQRCYHRFILSSGSNNEHHGLMVESLLQIPKAWIRDPPAPIISWS